MANVGRVIGAPAHGSGCEALRTCAQCTAGATATACRWSFPEQKCFAAGGGAPTTAAAATTAADCPKFRSVGGSENVTTVIVSDGDGTPAPPEAFTRFLANSSRITCHVNEDDYDGHVDEDYRTIRCVRPTGGDEWTPGFCAWPSAVAYLAIVVDDGPPLVFDDARDHYVSLYPESCERTCPRASCTACQWDAGRYRHYCTWCPARDECGPYHACDRRRLADLRRADEADDYAEPLPLDGRCTRGLGPFSPTSGPWTGGTVLRIDVPDRGTLLWHPAGHGVAVTVAGRDCTDPRWSGDAVVCTVAAAPPPYVGDAGSEPAVAGPVVLTIDGTPEVAVRSAAEFRFVGGPEQPGATAAVPEPRPPSTAGPAPSAPPSGPAADPGQTVLGDAVRVRGTWFPCLLGVVVQCLVCLGRRVLP